MFKKQCDCGCNRPMGYSMNPQMMAPMGAPAAPYMDGGCGGCQAPIVEPTNTTCLEKDFFCEVPHVCPMHTHTTNRVHYVHTYKPEYTCSESTEVINNDCGSCCQFMNR